MRQFKKKEKRFKFGSDKINRAAAKLAPTQGHVYAAAKVQT